MRRIAAIHDTGHLFGPRVDSAPAQFETFRGGQSQLIYTARVMSQAYPWFAQEAGLFKKYDLDVPLVFVTPGAPAVAAILSGDSEVAVIGAASITRPFVQGNKDPVFIGGIKSLLTHSIIAKPDIKARSN